MENTTLQGEFVSAKQNQQYSSENDPWAESDPFLTLSGSLLAKDWLTDEEDESWKDLQIV